MTIPTVKLLHGSARMDLQDASGGGAGRYKVSGVFEPPTAFRDVTYSDDDRGSRAVEKRLTNVEFTFYLHVKANTPQELERGKRELQSFLNRASGKTPLYLAYRSYDFDGADFEPHFGLMGAYARYEIVHGELGEEGTREKYAANVFVDVPVHLVLRPQSEGLRMHAGQATGGIFEDYIGKVNRISRGTIIPPAANNVFTNPAFMNATWNNGWTATGSGFLTSENRDENFALFGDVSARLSKSTVAAGDRFSQSLTLTGAATYYLSCYIKMIDSSEPTGVALWYGGTATTTQTAIGDGWYRLTATITGTGVATQTGVAFTATTTIGFADGFQCTLTKHSAFFHGDMIGCSWASTKHLSVSSRTAARLRYAYNDILNVRAGWTFCLVWVPPIGTSGTRTFVEDDIQDLIIRVTSSDEIYAQVDSGESVTSSAITITAHDPVVLHVTYDGTTITVYNAGASVGSAGPKSAGTTAPTWVYVGDSEAGGSECGGTLMRLETFPRAMTAAQVADDYAAVLQQVTDGDRIGPLPWVYTVDGDNIIDNDNDGTRHNYAVVGGLMGDNVDVSYKLDSSTHFVLASGLTWGSLPVDQRYFDKDILTTGGTNTLLFKNGSGTADVDANADNVTRISLSTSTTNSMATAITPVGARLLKEAKSVRGFFVAKDAGTNTNVQVQFEIMFGDNQETYYQSAWRTISTSASFRPYATAELPLDFDDVILDSNRKVGFRFRFRRTQGSSTQNFDISHAIWLPNYCAVYTGNVGATVAADMCYARGRLLEVVDDANPTLTIGRATFNRPLFIKPEYLNVLMLQHTYDNHSAAGTSIWTSLVNLEVEQFAVTPRFDIY